MLKTLLIIVFSTAFFFGPANSIMACTCRTFVWESDKELVVRAKAAADSIFVGRVVRILKEKDRRGVPTGDYIAVFNVTEMWKGKRRKQIRIVNGTDRCCLCE